MFELIQRGCERFFRIPPEPGPPPGDEASTRVFRAAPGFLRYLKMVWILGTVVAVAIALLVDVGIMVFTNGLEDKAPLSPTLIVLGLILLLLFVIASRLVSLAMLLLDFDKRWYVVTDRSLRIREGVVHVREMTITFANIQNIEVQQGPLQRLFRIADLRVDTAGGGGSPDPSAPGGSMHTALFRGIDNADEVKSLIQQRLRGLRDAGLGDTDDQHLAVAPAPAEQDVLGALSAVLAEAQALRAAAAPR